MPFTVRPSCESDTATMGFNLALPLLLLLVDYTSCASLLFNPPPTPRRAALTNFVSAFAVAAAHNQKAFAEEIATTPAYQTLSGLNAGTRKLSEAGITEEGDLVKELLRRTEANKERNAAIGKQTTEANAFTAIDGSGDKRRVTDMTGRNRYLDAKEIRSLTQQRRLACAPSVMEPCRMIDPGIEGAAPLALPEVKALQCDAGGRNCRFQ